MQVKKLETGYFSRQREQGSIHRLAFVAPSPQP
jgi:hypothetical protein